MNHTEFKIGIDFTCADRTWRVTDIGTRTIVAIPVREGWMNGPPYAVHEFVFDENDQPTCQKVEP